MCYGANLSTCEPWDRQPRQDLLALRFGHLVPGHVGVDEARTHDIDGDSTGTQFLGQAFGHAYETRLGSTVSRLTL